MVIFKGEQQGELKETVFVDMNTRYNLELNGQQLNPSLRAIEVRYLVEVKVIEDGQEVTKLQWWNPEECNYSKPTPVGGDKS